jgi:hypothetical protein
MELEEHRGAGAEVERNVVVNDTARPAGNSSLSALHLDLQVMDGPVGKPVVWLVVWCMQPTSLKKRWQVVYVHYAIDRRWVRHLHDELYRAP